MQVMAARSGIAMQSCGLRAAGVLSVTQSLAFHSVWHHGHPANGDLEDRLISCHSTKISKYSTLRFAGTPELQHLLLSQHHPKSLRCGCCCLITAVLGRNGLGSFHHHAQCQTMSRATPQPCGRLQDDEIASHTLHECLAAAVEGAGSQRYGPPHGNHSWKLGALKLPGVGPWPMPS